jgi:hypothetical protein
VRRISGDQLLHFDFDEIIEWKGQREMSFGAGGKLRYYSSNLCGCNRRQNGGLIRSTNGAVQLGHQDFGHFVSEMYLPWAKANKRTWRND